MKRCLFLLHEGYSGIGLGCLTDALAVANWLGRETRYAWDHAAMAGRDPPSFGGLRIAADPAADLAATPWDFIFVVASFDPRAMGELPWLAPFLRQAYRNGATVCGIETGAAALADAGLVEGGEVSVHWANRDGFAEAWPNVRLSEAPVSRHHRCLTCVGGVYTLDLALHLIEQDAGRQLALEVSEHLGRSGRYLESPMTQASERPAPPRTRALERALKAMDDTIEDPVPVAEIAAQAGLSLRQMERLFRQHFDATPKAHYLALRLTRAQNLLQQTAMSVGEVAASTGFQSFAHFSRTYKAQFGVSPNRDREQKLSSTVPRVFLRPAQLEE